MEGSYNVQKDFSSTIRKQGFGSMLLPRKVYPVKDGVGARNSWDRFRRWRYCWSAVCEVPKLPLTRAEDDSDVPDTESKGSDIQIQMLITIYWIQLNPKSNFSVMVKQPGQE